MKKNFVDKQINEVVKASASGPDWLYRRIKSNVESVRTISNKKSSSDQHNTKKTS